MSFPASGVTRFNHIYEYNESGYDITDIYPSGEYFDPADISGRFLLVPIPGSVTIYNNPDQLGTGQYVVVTSITPGVHEVYVDQTTGKIGFNPLETWDAAYAFYDGYGSLVTASGFYNRAGETLEQIQEHLLSSGVPRLDSIESSFATHNHDNRYYTEVEIDNIVAGLQASGSYATVSQLNTASGVLNASISGHIADHNNPHAVTYVQVGASPSGHTHDTRYYTKSEMDDTLTAYTIEINQLSINKEPVFASGPLNTYLRGDKTFVTITPSSIGAYTKTEVDTIVSGISSGSGYATLSDLATTSGVLQTQIDGKAATSHTHDDRYFTESETTTLLGNYATTVDLTTASGVLRAYTSGHIVNTNNPHNVTYVQVGASPSGHTHDDRYYTESEVNAIASGLQPSGNYATVTQLTTASGVLAANLTAHLGDYNNPHAVNFEQVGASPSGHDHDDRYYDQDYLDTMFDSFQAEITSLGVNKEPAFASGALTTYLRGDKTFQTLDTSVVPENGNQYFTNARARSAISVSGVPLTYNSSTGVIGITQAGISTSGWLSPTDWNTFNNKQAVNSELTGLTGISGYGYVVRNASGNYITRPLASGTNINITYLDGISGVSTISLNDYVQIKQLSIDNTSSTYQNTNVLSVIGGYITGVAGQGIYLQAGDVPGATNRPGGNITIQGGVSSVTNGGSIYIYAGAGTPEGSIYLEGAAISITGDVIVDGDIETEDNVTALQYTSLATTGTAPFIVSSTTLVSNLNANYLNGNTFAVPGPIGFTTASSGYFTDIYASGILNVSGVSSFGNTSSLSYTNTTAGSTGNKANTITFAKSGNDSVSSALVNHALYVSYADTGTFTRSSGTASDSAWGAYISASHTGATSGTGANKNVYGLEISATNTGTVSSGTSTRNVYGAKITVVGSIDGTSTAYGLYIDVSGANTTYGIYSNKDIYTSAGLAVDGVVSFGDTLGVDGIATFANTVNCQTNLNVTNYLSSAFLYVTGINAEETHVVYVVGGYNSGNDTGQSILLQAGSGNGGIGGNVQILAGAPVGGGNAGSITIQAPDSPSGEGGSVYIYAGGGDTAGGLIYIGSGSEDGIQLNNAVTGQAFTFTSGTFSGVVTNNNKHVINYTNTTANDTNNKAAIHTFTKSGTDTSNATLTNYGLQVNYTDTGAVTPSSTNATIDVAHGINVVATHSGTTTAGSGTATKTLYGVNIVSTLTGTATGVSTRTNYALYASAVGSSDGTSTAYGAYLSATNADTNWGLYVAAGESFFAEKITTTGASDRISSTCSAIATSGKNIYIATTSSTANNTDVASLHIVQSCTSTDSGTDLSISNYGTYLSFTDSGSYSNTFGDGGGIKILYGSYISVTSNGATSGDTGDKNVYGVYVLASNTGTLSSGASTRTTFGGYFNAAGSTTGTATVYGIYATASNGDNNYGVVGHGTSGTNTPIATAVAGNATKPAYSMVGDQDTGAYFPAANQFGISCGGSLVGNFTSTGLNSCAIGASTASTGAFTTLTATSSSTVFTVTQSTVGNIVMILKSTATNDDPTETLYHARLATTDATQTTLWSLATTTDTTIYVEADVVARRTGGSSGTTGDGAGYKIVGTFKNISGTVTQIGSTDQIAQESQAGFNAVFNISGATVYVQVIGATNNNITWHGAIRVMSVGT